MIRSALVRSRVPAEAAALFAALRLRDADASGLRSLSETQWKALLRFCDLAHLTLPLAGLRVEGLPQWVNERLQTNVADNARRFEGVKTTYREAASALAGAGVDYVVIKGFSQAPDYVDDPRLRQQSDIDIYCDSSSHIRTTQRALESIGYEPDRKIDYSAADHAPTMLRSGDWTWRGNAFDPEMPLSIELHFCLWNEGTSLVAIPEVKQFWDRRVTREIAGISVPTLSAEDQLAYFSLHILRNLLMRDSVVHHVYELATFLHKHAKDDGFWREWSELHDSQLRAKQAITFSIAQQWFGCELSAVPQREIERLPSGQAAWLECFDGSAREHMFVENKDVVWLHLALLSHTKDRFTVLRRTFLPNRLLNRDTPEPVLSERGTVANRKELSGFVSYLFRRSVSHTMTTVRTLYRGLLFGVYRSGLTGQFWRFLFASLFFDLGFSIYFFLFNLFLVGHNYTEKTLGLITSAMAIGNLCGAVPAGWMASRYGLRAVLLGVFTLATGISAMRVFLLSRPMQLGLAFLMGATLSAWAVCLSPAIAQLTKEKQRPLGFSLIFSVGIGAGALGGFVAGRLPGWGGSVFHVVEPLRLALLLSCGLALVGTVPAMRLIFERSTQRARPRITTPSPFLLRFLGAAAIWALVTGSFSPFANVYFAEHMKMPLPEIGNAFSISQLLQTGAVLVAPLLFRRLGIAGGIVLTQISAGVLLWVIAAANRPVTAIVGYAAFAAFQWMNEPGIYSMLMNGVSPDQREGAAALHSMVMSASQAVAAALAGAAFARFGYGRVLPAIAAVAIFAAIFWSRLGKFSDRSHATQGAMEVPPEILNNSTQRQPMAM